MRSWCGVSVALQSSWNQSDYAAYNGWRVALQDLGVLVFSIEIGRGDVRGFSSGDPHAPLITVNSSAVSPSARVFTIAHELGHLVTRTDAACIEPSDLFVDADVERWCERFAAAFLMPTAAVQELMARRQVQAGAAGLHQVRETMNYFHVSARAAALRLIDLGFAPIALYPAVEAAFRPREQLRAADDKIKRPPRYAQRETQYGPRTLRQVLNGLPETAALRVLRVTVDDARKISERVGGIDATL